MIHNLTKFQHSVWTEIKPHITEEHNTILTFDDDLKIEFTKEMGDVTITIFPNSEIAYTLKRKSGGFETSFINPENIEELIKLIEKD